jgi:multiple antibiotic resistance protein
LVTFDGTNFSIMEFDLKEFISATMVLFAVIDILGSIPIIVSLRERVGHIQSEKATIVSTLIMVSFLFVGKAILSLLGVDVNSFAIAGAIVIFFLALEMILGVRIYKEETPQTASIVPIAFPLIAGAGTLTTLIAIKAEYATINILLAIIVNMILVYIVLKSSNKISKALGPGGLSVLRKVFGIILMAIAVKLFFTNLSNLI